MKAGLSPGNVVRSMDGSPLGRVREGHGAQGGDERDVSENAVIGDACRPGLVVHLQDGFVEPDRTPDRDPRGSAG
jgi:hypothetical protein